MKKIYVSNLQKVLTETFLGDIDLTRLRHASILSIYLNEEIQVKS